MGRRIIWFGIGVALLLLSLPATPSSSFEITQPVNAQLPDPGNVTVPGMGDSLAVTAVLRDGVAYVEIPERDRHEFIIEIEDHRVEGVGAAAGAVQVQCRASPETDDYRFWGFTQPGTRTLVNKGDTAETRLNVFTQSMPTPEFFVLNVRCIGLGAMQGELITEFHVGVRVEPYMYVRMLNHPDFPPPMVRPDQHFSHKVIIENLGNRDTFFRGVVDGPPGWEVRYPETVYVNAGERKEIEFSGVAPAEKLYYRYESALFDVRYWPDGQEQSGESRIVPATVHGFYLHPALIPLILLGMLAVAMVIFVIIYARRTVEEQVLGKPVPPWRIPVEREYLKRLEREDPDEFYVVRYHLMVEEHLSALFWYKHFKHATRKDRKLERKWLKKTDKVKAKTDRLRGRQEALEGRMARRLRVVPARRRRRLVGLETKVLASQWKEQRKLLKIRKKAIRRIDKLHSKKAKKEQKRQSADFEKERKKVEKQNKKLIKQGDDPLPLPEEPEYKRSHPEFPELVEVPIQAAADSAFAVKAERLNRRFNRKIARRTNRGKHHMRKKGAKREKKANRLKRKIPEAPSTHLYDEDKFIPEDEVVVEDSRPRIQRMLNIPVLEEREALRRRRMVYRVRIKEAASRQDKQAVEELKRKWEKERLQIRGKSGQGPQGGQEEGQGGPEKGSGAAREGDAQRKEATDSGGAKGGKFSLLRKRRSKGSGEDTIAATQGDKEDSDLPK